LTWTSSTKSVTRFFADVPWLTLVVSAPSMIQRFSAALEPSIEMPPERDSLLAPGAWVTIELKSRPFGSFSNVSAVMLVLRALCLVSMIGDSAVTDTVSATPPTASARSTVRIWPRRSSMFSTFAGVKPCILANTSYFAGRSPGTR
jgi:hypothetical protein